MEIEGIGLKKIEASNAEAIGYDQPTGRLAVLTKEGPKVYHGVASGVYSSILAGASAGKPVDLELLNNLYA
jgi:hypothetical protein